MSFARSAYSAVATVVAEMTPAVSCVTSVPLIAKRTTLSVYTVSFPDNQEFVRLRATPALLFAIQRRGEVERDTDRATWRAVVAGYHYEVQNARAEAADSPATKDVMTFDWHPDGRSHVTTPHLHVQSAGTRLSRKHHIPTGPVSLAAVVRFLIAELGVAPVRDDWQDMLVEGDSRGG